MKQYLVITLLVRTLLVRTLLVKKITLVSEIPKRDMKPVDFQLGHQGQQGSLGKWFEGIDGHQMFHRLPPPGGLLLTIKLIDCFLNWSG